MGVDDDESACRLRRDTTGIRDTAPAGIGGIHVQPYTRVGAAAGEIPDGIDGGRCRRPAVATTAVTPSKSMSGSMRNMSSTGALRYSSPTSRAAFSTLKFACSDATTTPPGRRVRAAASAAIVAVDAVSSMWPCQPLGRPSSCASQSITVTSSSVAAGDDNHVNALTFSAAMRNS